MAKALSENHRLRPRELFFTFLGAMTGAGLVVFWFKLVPEAMEHQGLQPSELAGMASLWVNPAVEVLVLVVGAVLLAAGLATRLSMGKERATWIMAGGDAVLFLALALSVNALYEPVLANLGEAEGVELSEEEKGEKGEKAIAEDDREE